MTEILNKIKAAISEDRILLNEPMKKHTTFKIGGNADIFVMPRSCEEIAEIIKVCKELKVPYYVIGNGSNLLVKDGGFRGVIIQLFRAFSNICVQNDTIVAQAGALMSSIGSLALKNNLTGFEFAAGIPGTVGGGVCMNAGAYGGELKDVVTRVKVLYNGEIVTLSNEECGFDYRTSNIQKNNMLVLEVEIRLQQGEYASIKEVMSDLAKKRSEKQPLEYPSAGSTFKRPQGYFAGKLIDDAGLRGFSVGDAQVSQKHCGFVINKGNATAEQVIELMNRVSCKVKQQFGVELEPEVRIIGADRG